MAAITPSATYRESVGSLTLHIFTFASADSSTYKSGLPNAIAYWAQALTPACGGVGITATTGTTGTTFDIATLLAAGAVNLYVLSRT